MDSLKNSKGQLSIFLGIALVSVMALMAFVVNVGLFVKAKINLQNAVDAAAWTGAAVQARQLSNIAYVNYHLRQIYKEWMLKYYIFGSIGGLQRLNSNILARPGPGGIVTNFRQVTNSYDTGEDIDKVVDKFNTPSICVLISGQSNSTNICNTVSVPGLPRFGANIPLSDIAQSHRNFADAMASIRGDSCSDMSNINFATAVNWTYSGGQSFSSNFTNLLNLNRMGAWPSALITAIRVRNLEALVNRPPIPLIDRQSVEVLRSSSQLAAYNERPLKAFMAGYRNLGGGIKKGGGGGGDTDELASSFTLTELSPQSSVSTSGTGVEFTVDPSRTV